MWPWAHLAFGYLLLSVSDRVRGRTPPSGRRVLAAAFGTQFPDLVDKPLAWTFGVLPSGRSLAHSALTMTLVLGALFVLLRVRRPSDRSALTPATAGAFAIGYASHLVGDGLVAFVEGEWVFLTYLAWPLLPLPPYEHDSGIIEHLLAFQFDPWATFGFLLAGVALVAWWRDGRPGLRAALGIVR